MTAQKKTLGIIELMQHIRQELMSYKSPSDSDIFSIDEVTLELNFTVSGDIESGFDFGVITLGSNVSEEHVQKITIKMTPLVSKQQIIDRINQDSQKAQTTVSTSTFALTRDGRTSKGGKQVKILKFSKIKV